MKLETQLWASVKESRRSAPTSPRAQWYLRVRESDRDAFVPLMSEDDPRSIALYTDHTRACDDAFAIRALGWQAKVVEVVW